MPFGARRTFGVVPISAMEFQFRRDEDLAQADYINRDRIDSLPADQRIRFYSRKGLLKDLKEIVKIKAGGLVECPCNIDAPDKGGWTAMHIAAYENFEEVVAYLIKAKANVDAETTGGFTPLYLAVTNGSEHAAKALREHGAQYEWSSGQGTICRNRFGARTLSDPHQPKFHKSREYREIKHFDVKNPHGQSPYTSTALFPHGQQLSGVAQQFAIQGAANRFAHPAASYLGSMWKKDLLNEDLLKHPMKGGVRWRDLKIERFKADSSKKTPHR